MRILVAILGLLTSLRLTHSLTGYECSHPLVNMSAINLLEVEDCQPIAPNIKNTTIQIQLLQKKSFSKVPYFQCKVWILKFMVYCGFVSHISANTHTLTSRIETVSRQQCQEIVQFGRYSPERDITLTGIKNNTI